MLVVLKAAATCSIWATALIIRGKAGLVPHFLEVDHPSDPWIQWCNDGQYEAHDDFPTLPNHLQVEDYNHPASMDSNFPSLPPIGSPSLSHPYFPPPPHQDGFDSMDLTSRTFMGNEVPVTWGDQVFGNHVNPANPSSYPEHVPLIPPHSAEQRIASLEEQLTRAVVIEKQRKTNRHYSRALLAAARIATRIRGAGVRPSHRGRRVQPVHQPPSTTESPPGPSGTAAPRRPSRKKIAEHPPLPPAGTQPFETPVHESPTISRGKPPVAQQDTPKTKTLEPQNHSQPEIEIPSSLMRAIERLSESANKEDMPRGKRPTTRVPSPPPKIKRLVDIE